MSRCEDEFPPEICKRIRKILEEKVKSGQPVKINGDGDLMPKRVPEIDETLQPDSDTE